MELLVRADGTLALWREQADAERMASVHAGLNLDGDMAVIELGFDRAALDTLADLDVIELEVFRAPRNRARKRFTISGKESAAAMASAASSCLCCLCKEGAKKRGVIHGKNGVSS